MIFATPMDLNVIMKRCTKFFGNTTGLMRNFTKFAQQLMKWNIKNQFSKTTNIFG